MELQRAAELVREHALQPGDLIELWSDSELGVTVYKDQNMNLVPVRVPKGTKITFIGGPTNYFTFGGIRCWIDSASVGRVHRLSELTLSLRRASTS